MGAVGVEMFPPGCLGAGTQLPGLSQGISRVYEVGAELERPPFHGQRRQYVGGFRNGR